MDIENLKSWASQPDVCRCCLSTSGSWDMLAEYLNDAGEKQVYSEILHNCFGISLALLSEWGPGRLVCDQCVGRLHDAHIFKKQVLQAEDLFTTYINSKLETIQDTEKSKLNHGHSHLHNEQAEISNVGINSENFAESNHRLCTDNETIPISLLGKSSTRRKRGSIENNGISDVCEYETNADDINVTNTVPQETKPVKTISERKRIKITCSTVLKETTACPFRHHRSWFQCFFCTQAFMEMTALRVHTAQTHTDLEELMNQLKRYPRSLQIDISELQCRRCELNLYDVEGMRVHLLSTHSLVIYKECIADYKVNGSPYTCHLCSKQFHVFRTLTTHLNEHYANFICDICGKSYLNSKRLKVHHRTHESGCFPCTKCGKVLKTKTSQVNHMESHSKRIIKCQICSKPMKHYNDRVKHMSEEHNITHKFKCPICSREYNIKHYLATHIRQTHGHKNKKCAECGMAFVTNHGLKKHMQKHVGSKAFSCQVCSKTYARSYSLREHMRQHDT